VLDGLAPGERAVVAGTQELADGVPVREIESGANHAAKLGGGSAGRGREDASP
jgi:hypothetical protein